MSSSTDLAIRQPYRVIPSLPISYPPHPDSKLPYLDAQEDSGPVHKDPYRSDDRPTRNPIWPQPWPLTHYLPAIPHYQVKASISPPKPAVKVKACCEGSKVVKALLDLATYLYSVRTERVGGAICVIFYGAEYGSLNALWWSLSKAGLSISYGCVRADPIWAERS